MSQADVDTEFAMESFANSVSFYGPQGRGYKAGKFTMKRMKNHEDKH